MEPDDITTALEIIHAIARLIPHIAGTVRYVRAAWQNTKRLRR
ncbi:hypothetical protein [Arthrobacter sp. MAHUQ-56]